jgi:hypothetical protein
MRLTRIRHVEALDHHQTDRADNDAGEQRQ